MFSLHLSSLSMQPDAGIVSYSLHSHTGCCVVSVILSADETMYSVISLYFIFTGMQGLCFKFNAEFICRELIASSLPIMWLYFTLFIIKL